jgi:hypothetical protein
MGVVVELRFGYTVLQAVVVDAKTAEMTKLILPLLVGLLVLSGCASHYVIKLTNGGELTTASKPQLKDGAYHFKDAKGQERAIGAARVREIAPASIAAEEAKPKPGQQLHKRKWYLLWLG